MNLPWNPAQQAHFLADIKADRVFSFARYGDGEFYWMTGGMPQCGTRQKKFMNHSGHETFDAGSEELRQAIMSKPTYRLGGMGVMRAWRDEASNAKYRPIYDFLVENDLTDLEWYTNLLWVKPQALYAAKNMHNPLLDTLAKCHVVMVGPPWLRALRDVGVLKYKHFIEVPPVNCYMAKEALREKMYAYWLECHLKHRLVFALSCCYTSNLLIHDLYDSVGTDSWMIDFGSIWEPYVGKSIRGYHSDIRKRGPWPLKP